MAAFVFGFLLGIIISMCLLFVLRKFRLAQAKAIGRAISQDINQRRLYPRGFHPVTVKLSKEQVLGATSEATNKGERP